MELTEQKSEYYEIYKLDVILYNMRFNFPVFRKFTENISFNPCEIKMNKFPNM